MHDISTKYRTLNQKMVNKKQNIQKEFHINIQKLFINNYQTSDILNINELTVLKKIIWQCATGKLRS